MKKNILLNFLFSINTTRKRSIIIVVLVLLSGFEAIAKTAAVSALTSAKIHVQGKVVAQNGTALLGVTIAVKGSTRIVSTNERGEFDLVNIDKTAVLIFSYIGYESQEISLNGRSRLEVFLKVQINNLDETVVIGYGSSKKQLLTGSIVRITSKELELQPVANPLSALQGRTAGVQITSGSGVPGSNITLQIRGVNSITASSNALYIIDGVPVPSTSINKVSGASGSISPMNSINPADIESIDILKDADATAIYGSRGANGVVLITTKKGKAGNTKFDLDVYTGSSAATRLKNDWLHTKDYLAIRRAAFKADGITPDANNAPDLTVWDTTAYTDWQKLIIGGTAPTSNVQASLSGGDEHTRFLLGAGYHHDGAILFGNNYENRSDIHLNVEHNSWDKKLFLSTNITYSFDNIKTIGYDPFYYIQTSPNYPQYDSTGKNPYFISGNNSFYNPIAYTYTTAKTKTDNFVGNAKIRYSILKDLDLSVNLGYTKMNQVQVSTFPTQYQNPTVNNTYTNYSYFGTSYTQTYSIEPQADYRLNISKGKLQALLGGTFQSSVSGGSYIFGANFPSNSLLESIGAAALVPSKSTSYTQYKFTSVFGRLNYNWEEKYIVNASFRRDGSSRFGPGNKFGNFWAVGGAWLFAKENYFKDNFSFINYGKLRASYGLTGNDQIGDYKYLSLYTNTTYPYQGTTGLYASQIANSNYRWEENRKLEIAIELGIIKNRVVLTTAWYKNRSGNLLTYIPLAAQTGFSYYIANLPAIVQNNGWEFELNTTNINKKDFKWTSSFNLTLPVNKLVSYPNLANSTYSNTYEVGKSLNLFRAYHFTGIDPATGVPQVQDVDKNGVISYPNDYVTLGNRDPKAYGGLGNTFSFKGFELQFLFQFNIQKNYGFLYEFYQPPGFMYNTTKSLTTHYWQKPGDNAAHPGLTATTSSAIYQAYYSYYTWSDPVLVDASYIRLKNLSFSYTLPNSLVKHAKLSNTKIFLQAQNLLTLTHYDGLDPEVPYSTPPLKTITIGIHSSL